METKKIKKEIIDIYKKSGIFFTKKELEEEIELVSFYGMENFHNFGISCLFFIDTLRVGAKDLVLLPGQICPQHVHQKLDNLSDPGKEETFRCRWGELYLYVDGDKTEKIKAKIPEWRVFGYNI